MEMENASGKVKSIEEKEWKGVSLMVKNTSSKLWVQLSLHCISQIDCSDNKKNLIKNNEDITIKILKVNPIYFRAFATNKTNNRTQQIN